MGLLDQVFGDTQSGSQGGTSPITLGLLALLAYRTYEGKGRLADMLGRGANTGGAGNSPPIAPEGSPAGAPGSATGGLGDLIRNGLGGLLAGGVGWSPERRLG